MDSNAQPHGLTPRMRQTLDLLCRGSEKEIARALGVSRQTVHEFVKMLHGYFDVHSRGELLARVNHPSENGAVVSTPPKKVGGGGRKPAARSGPRTVSLPGDEGWTRIRFPRLIRGCDGSATQVARH